MGLQALVYGKGLGERDACTPAVRPVVVSLDPPRFRRPPALGARSLAGLVPTAVSLIRLYSHAGLGLPPLVPVYEFLMNTVGWSLPALSWFLMLSYEDAEDVEEQWQRTAQSRGNILSPGGPSLSNPMLV